MCLFQILQWVQYSYKMGETKVPTERYAEELNSYLANRTFMSGSNLTVADVAIATAVHSFLL